jgi:hypothetical protein
MTNYPHLQPQCPPPGHPALADWNHAADMRLVAYRIDRRAARLAILQGQRNHGCLDCKPIIRPDGPRGPVRIGWERCKAHQCEVTVRGKSPHPCDANGHETEYGVLCAEHFRQAETAARKASG